MTETERAADALPKLLSRDGYILLPIQHPTGEEGGDDHTGCGECCGAAAESKTVHAGQPSAEGVGIPVR